MTRRMNGFLGWQLKATTCACMLLFGCAQQPAATSAAPVASTATSPQQPASEAPGAAARADSPRAPIDPGVLQALDRMGDALRHLKSFELQVSTTTDEPLANDQMAQMGRSAILKVRRPDALRADMRNDRGDRKVLFYNGQKASLWDPATQFFTTVDAPPTLAELVRVLADRYGIELPAADLFYWDSNKLDERGVHSADFLGHAEVDGSLTEHYAIRQDGMDWQIWVERSAIPLPRKLVIRTTDVAAHPQHTVLMRWKLSPKVTSADFEFRPPAGARQIVIQTLDSGATSPRIGTR
ncbi:DUF2092 domain-containing protein [Variovorax sp. M-6]|uniref:DUF2092 domain-containing protein n=1 Tax=Variovorax sp. M-6 TaxID=3233041 RepID=UPI003F9967B3